MDLVKKNLISIIFGVVALLALIASFYPLRSYVTELQGKLDQRKLVAGQIEQMISKPRYLPVVSPDDSNPAEQLPEFPTPAIIKQGEEIVKQVAAESTAMRDLAVNKNKHTLLVPGSLPDAASFKRIEFRDAYRNYMPTIVPGAVPVASAPGAPVPLPVPQLTLVLKGGVPISPAEITKAIADETAKIKKDKLYPLPNGAPGNQAEVDALIREMTQKLPEQMQMAVAQASRIYVEPTAFDVNLTIAGTPTPDNIFVAQISLWVQQDVVAAIKETNNTSDAATGQPPKNVIEAPVKRLHKIKIIEQPLLFITSGSATPGAVEPPPSSDPDAEIKKVFTASPTGRVSNGLFDVVHFIVQVDVEAAKVPMFLETLSKDRFMTAYRVDLKVLDGSAVYAAGLRFGNKPVVTLNLDCEALFFRQWTVPFMPAVVKTKLGIQPQQVAAQ